MFVEEIAFTHCMCSIGDTIYLLKQDKFIFWSGNVYDSLINI